MSGWFFRRFLGKPMESFLLKDFLKYFLDKFWKNIPEQASKRIPGRVYKEIYGEISGAFRKVYEEICRRFFERISARISKISKGFNEAVFGKNLWKVFQGNPWINFTRNLQRKFWNNLPIYKYYMNEFLK